MVMMVEFAEQNDGLNLQSTTLHLSAAAPHLCLPSIQSKCTCMHYHPFARKCACLSSKIIISTIITNIFSSTISCSPPPGTATTSLAVRSGCVVISFDILRLIPDPGAPDHPTQMLQDVAQCSSEAKPASPLCPNSSSATASLSPLAQICSYAAAAVLSWAKQVGLPLEQQGKPTVSVQVSKAGCVGR